MSFHDIHDVGESMVIRTLSHTDKQMTMKVMSRGQNPEKRFDEKPEYMDLGTKEEFVKYGIMSMKSWADFCASQENVKGHQFMVIKVLYVINGP